jgi:putative transposase
LEVIREVKSAKPFSMQACVILDDHLHWIVKPESNDFSKIVQSIKVRFTFGLKKRLHHSGKLSVWQRRFWDHIIRDEDDLHRHMDYIHYNPVRHAYVQRPVDYPWSSLGEYVKRGKYSKQWGAKREPENLAEMALK